MLKSIELAPESSCTKYLYLAQLCAGKEALDLYQKALALLSKQPSSEDIKRQMSQVYTAMTELYMSDETLECGEDALSNEMTIKKCEAFLGEARNLDPYSAETICCQAQFWLSVYGVDEKKSDVVNLLKDFLGKIYAGCVVSEPEQMGAESLEEQEQHEELVEKAKIGALIKCLDYDARMTIVKLFLECQESAHALCPLDSLYEENDSPVELDYLSALVATQLGYEAETIREHLESFVEKWSQSCSYMTSLSIQEMEDGGELMQMYQNAIEMLEQLGGNGGMEEDNSHDMNVDSSHQ